MNNRQKKAIQAFLANHPGRGLAVVLIRVRDQLFAVIQRHGQTYVQNDAHDLTLELAERTEGTAYPGALVELA